MSVFLRRSLSSSCLRFQHSVSYSITFALRRQSLSTHNLAPDASQASEPRKRKARHSSAVAGKEPLKKSRKPKNYVEPEKPRPNLLEQTKVQDYLDYVASTNKSVTLEDIERCKPKLHATPGTSEYAEDYNSTLENLVRSFSKVQLARFLELYGLEPPVKRTKWLYAESIIERQWKWPSLTDIQKRQRDWSEVTYKTFPLNPNQAFLILGKDGVDLLSLSRKYNVHVSFSANPLSLRVEGLRGSLDNLSQYIGEFKNDVRAETFVLPGGKPPRSELLQRISRITGVLTESVEDSLIRLSYRNSEQRAATAARKLTMRSVFEPSSVTTLVETQKSLPALESNIFPHAYSLYPFLSSRTLPWDVDAGSLLRLRGVGEWLRVNSREGVLTGSGGTALTMNEERIDIRDTLLQQLAASSQDPAKSHRGITASFGHVLVCSPQSQRAAIVAPLQVQGELSQLLTWIQSQKRIFLPSLPRPLLDSRRTQQRLLHRVVYQVLPKKSEGSSPAERSLSTEFFKAEFHIEIPNPPSQLLSPEVGQAVENTYTATDIIITPKYWTGVDARLDLMLPNCSMDIRFFATELTSVAKDSWPQEMQDYFSELQSFLSFTEEGAQQPEPPYSFVHDGVTYSLKSSCSVRQSVESSQPQSLETTTSILPTVSESILDLDSNEKYTTCELLCPDIASQDSWTSFLLTCDQVVALASRPMSTSSIPDIPLS